MVGLLLANVSVAGVKGLVETVKLLLLGYVLGVLRAIKQMNTD